MHGDGAHPTVQACIRAGAPPAHLAILVQDHGSLLDDVELVPGISLPEHHVRRLKLHHLQRIRHQLLVVLH